ncbi:MAG: ABC transporter permease subunit, partial [Actinomycetes bacterium]
MAVTTKPPAGGRALSEATGGLSAGFAARFSRPLVADVVVGLAVFIVLFAVIALTDSANVPMPPSNDSAISSNPWDLPYYAARSLLRMMVALGLSYAFSLVFGYWAARNRKAEKIMVPALDILQSVPVLGFLSITVTGFIALFPGSELGLECASIFAIFTAMAWNITFSMYASSRSMSTEFDEMSRLFRLTAWMRFWRLDVPNATIGLVWNGMMSMAGAWFFLTASEDLTVNGNSYAIPGVGAFAGEAIDAGNWGNMAWAVVTMIIMIILVNIVLWRPLVAWSEKFRNEQASSGTAPKSFVLTWIRRARWPKKLGRIRQRASEWLVRHTRFLGTDARPIERIVTPRSRVWDVVFWVVVTAVLLVGLVGLYLYVTEGQGPSAFVEPLWLAFLTLLRVVVVIVLSTLIWVPVAVKVGLNPRLARIAQPVVQVCASFPANFLYPVVVTVFVAWHISLNWGAILLMMLGAQWYIMFNTIAGAQAIPTDLREAMADMRVGGWLWWKTFALPAVFGAYVTGGVTAAGGAWNASIVAERVSFGTTVLVAAGIGAYISEASATGNSHQVLL